VGRKAEQKTSLAMRKRKRAKKRVGECFCIVTFACVFAWLVVKWKWVENLELNFSTVIRLKRKSNK